MPTAYIKKLATESGRDVDELEDLWDKAKEQAKKEGKEKNWKYITGIFKNMLGKDVNNISEALTVSDLINAQPEDGPNYLFRKKIHRNISCRCGSKKFKASIDDLGKPIWICLSCFSVQGRIKYNKGNKDAEATNLV